MHVITSLFKLSNAKKYSKKKKKAESSKKSYLHITSISYNVSPELILRCSKMRTLKDPGHFHFLLALTCQKFPLRSDFQKHYCQNTIINMWILGRKKNPAEAYIQERARSKGIIDLFY